MEKLLNYIFFRKLSFTSFDPLIVIIVASQIHRGHSARLSHDIRECRYSLLNFVDRTEIEFAIPECWARSILAGDASWRVAAASAIITAIDKSGALAIQILHIDHQTAERIDTLPNRVGPCCDARLAYKTLGACREELFARLAEHALCGK
jgi:hypothetical protein